MPAFLRILAAEWLKTRRTAVGWLVFGAPLALALLLTWYLDCPLGLAHVQLWAFQALFEVWTALVIPFGAGLTSALLIQQEEQAGNFTGLLGYAGQRTGLYLGKLALLMLAATVSTLLAALGLLAGLKYSLHIDAQLAVGPFLMAAVLALAGALPLLAAHLWISFAWGKWPSISVGGAGLLLAALIGATSLGNQVWPWVPWAWPVRLAQFPGLFLAGVDLPPGSQPLELFWRQAPLGLTPALILFVLLAWGGCAWFSRWEGRAEDA